MPVCVRTPPSLEAAGANALMRVPCGTSSTLEFAGQHLPLRLRIKADMAYDGLAQQQRRRVCQFPGPAWPCRWQ
jgi:hypothetical protein